MALNPNHADNTANLACSCVVSCRPAEAIVHIKRAMRLSPIYPNWYLNILGVGHYLCAQYDEAEQALRIALQREPAYGNCRLVLALAHHAQGRTGQARQEAQEVLRQDPNFRLQSFEASLAIMKDRDLAAGFLATLRELGLQ